VLNLAVGRNHYAKGVVHHLFVFFAHLGGFGILFLSVLDSSPLLIPLGNDILFIAMTARKQSYVIYYTLMATAGSVLGCFSVDALSRKGGEKGLEKIVSPRRLGYVKKRIKESAVWALALASLMPPPFPFTPFVAGASSLQYPRKKLLAALAIARLMRFSIEGALAILFGRHILRLARFPMVEDVVVGLIIASVVGSVLSIIRSMKQGNT